ncbi:3-alpha-(Or 20-beta)-hydroxysteroid dehydrogenase [Colletotrichum higginsianum IMI 349063]|uniref:3-alpha-(Or 20-beta)-hydroxysteroid dehydrogenase n=1 Tax=Colletotrichum higginsianum (strain IMI 349063) TaxID=759273 RepID=A0A1B7YJV7_COLHI|nr:3-alpha-(Or 20-beta)-hydroxysteroid dehydrogenase [Colletotrichum higginsianum IMI 349063]OBR12361.1 3-alpha-(Or 20-beta)-hydroxysteroid dehydrogenase [Colletotrichum higginsianum IMI 349063]
MKGGGSIVNVGSITSTYASAGVAAYVACKRAGPGMVAEPRQYSAGQFGLSADTVPCTTKRIAEPWEIAALIACPLGDESGICYQGGMVC